MTMINNNYENPLYSKYASNEMIEVFSEQHKISIWRKLWYILAESEKELGLNITDTQLEEMKNNINNIDFDLAKQYETKFYHDVVSHIHTFGECCPNAYPIIHLGATSCFVTDNSELIQMKEALEIVIMKTKSIIKNLCTLARKYKEVPCVGLTHGQSAQLTTVGKRITLYIQDLVMDYENMLFLRDKFKLRGAKGAIGTQASFLSLFDNDITKVKELDRTIVNKMGFKEAFPITSQTYTRKFDYMVLSTLSGIAQSASKFATDMRLMQSRGEWEEPFGNSQVGSSAMAYKRNPILSERICSISRYVMSLPINSAITASSQWFERTLDDSANRKIVNSQAFLSVDSILIIMKKITDGITIYPKIIDNYVKNEIPFIISEDILMSSVKKGADRQKAHEIIRKYAMDTLLCVKTKNTKNNFLDKVYKDKYLSIYLNNNIKVLDPKEYVGCSVVQTEDYINYVEVFLNQSTKGGENNE